MKLALEKKAAKKQAELLSTSTATGNATDSRSTIPRELKEQVVWICALCQASRQFYPSTDA